MMKTIAAAAGLYVAGSAAGQSLHLSYTIEEIGAGLYQYDFQLSTAGLGSGMGWRGIVWGDCERCVSPLGDFNGDVMSLYGGEFTGFTTISGEHNGPMLADPEVWWEPETPGEQIYWSGVSSVKLGSGELLFSVLEAKGGAAPVTFEVAEQLPVCYADCDVNGTLDFFDFLCFQNAFGESKRWADCDNSGELDIYDFLCFVSEFESECE